MAELQASTSSKAAIPLVMQLNNKLSVTHRALITSRNMEEFTVTRVVNKMLPQCLLSMRIMEDRVEIRLKSCLCKRISTKWSRKLLVDSFNNISIKVRNPSLVFKVRISETANWLNLLIKRTMLKLVKWVRLGQKASFKEHKTLSKYFHQIKT